MAIDHLKYGQCDLRILNFISFEFDSHHIDRMKNICGPAGSQKQSPTAC